jgi:adenylate cyclase
MIGIPTTGAANGSNQSTPVWLRSPWLLLAGIAALAAILLLLDASPFARFDQSWTDYLLRLRFRMAWAPKPDPRIFVIGMENPDMMGASTTAAEYRTYAEIIDMVSDLKASAIAFDLILARGDQADDAPIVKAARNSRRVILADAVGNMRLPASLFADSGSPAGAINAEPDSDGVFRHYSYAYAHGKFCHPSLALAAYLMWQDALEDVTCPGGERVAWKELGPDMRTLSERTLPLSAFRLNFRSTFQQPWDRGFKYASVHDLRAKYQQWKAHGDESVLAGLPGQGSLVIVGAVATGVGDAGPTPFGRYEPLVQLHATALNDLIQNRLLREAPNWSNAIWTASVLFLFAVASRLTRGLVLLALIAAAIVLAVLIIDAGELFQRNFVMAGIDPAGFVAVALGIELARRSGFASLEKSYLRRYLSPRVADEVLRNPNVTQPRDAEIAVLLTDLRNFTTITERIGAQRTYDLLNAVFEIETEAVLANDGSMEHFVGDQFLAYWGAPQKQPDAADRAVQAGAIIIKRLDELHRNLPEDVKSLFGYGLAIHKGKALVGNKGSRLRLDYGILGDIVNATARIESLTKLYGVREIITREVLDSLKDKPRCRFLDRVRVKGRSQAMELHEVLLNPSPQCIALEERYLAAWHEYAAGQFDIAAQHFNELATCDRASAVLEKRCKELANASHQNWDGIYQLPDK